MVTADCRGDPIVKIGLKMGFEKFLVFELTSLHYRGLGPPFFGGPPSSQGRSFKIEWSTLITWKLSILKVKGHDYPPIKNHAKTGPVTLRYLKLTMGCIVLD